MLQETNFQHIKVGAHKSSHHNSPVFTKLYLCPTCSQHFKIAITNNVWGWRGVGCGDSSSQGPVSLFDHVKQVHGKEQHYFWAAVPSAAASSPSFFSFFSAPGIPSDIQCSCHETNGMITGKQRKVLWIWFWHLILQALHMCMSTILENIETEQFMKLY